MRVNPATVKTSGFSGFFDILPFFIICRFCFPGLAFY